MVFLAACRRIADSTFLLRLIFSALILVFGVNSYITAPLGGYENGLNVPDVRIAGYTPAELNLWYDRVGVEGCQVYIQAANWDFLAIMMTYPLFLGSMLIVTTRSTGLSENFAYIPLVTVVFDMVETYFQRKGCVLYPERLPEGVVAAAGYACVFKWIFLTVSLFFILGLRVKQWLVSQTANRKAE
jgi:hypothetical protein